MSHVSEPRVIIGIGSVPIGAAGGDLNGTYPAPGVIRINGATVPASGSLTTGNGLYVTAASTLSYSALNLAGGSNYVIGTLPIGNQANQIMAGDVTGTTASSTVVKLQSRNVSSITPQDGYVLTWVAANSDWEPQITNVSVGYAYGQLKADGTAASLILTTAGSFYLLNAWTIIDQSFSTIPSLTNNTITVNKSGVYWLHSSLSFHSPDNNFILTIGIFVNGIRLLNTEAQVDVKAAVQASQILVNSLHSLNAGDVVDIRLMSALNSKQIDVLVGAFLVTKIG